MEKQKHRQMRQLMTGGHHSTLVTQNVLLYQPCIIKPHFKTEYFLSVGIRWEACQRSPLAIKVLLLNFLPSHKCWPYSTSNTSINIQEKWTQIRIHITCYNISTSVVENTNSSLELLQTSLMPEGNWDTPVHSRHHHSCNDWRAVKYIYIYYIALNYIFVVPCYDLQ